MECNYSFLHYLVGGLEHILEIMSPTDECFSEGLKPPTRLFYWFHPQFVLNSCSPPRTKQASRVVGFKHLVFLLSLSGGADPELTLQFVQGGTL